MFFLTKRFLCGITEMMWKIRQKLTVKFSVVRELRIMLIGLYKMLNMLGRIWMNDIYERDDTAKYHYMMNLKLI